MKKLVALILVLSVTSLSAAQSFSPVVPSGVQPRGTPVTTLSPENFSLAFAFVKGLAILSFLLPQTSAIPNECVLSLRNAFIPLFVAGAVIGFVEFAGLNPNSNLKSRRNILAQNENTACVDMNENDECDEQDMFLERRSQTELALLSTGAVFFPGAITFCLFPGIIGLLGASAFADLSWSVGNSDFLITIAILVGAFLPFLALGRVLLGEAVTRGLAGPPGPEGGGNILNVSSSISLLNLASTTAPFAVTFYEPNGDLADVTIGGETNSEFIFDLLANASRTITLESEDPLRVISAKIAGGGGTFGASFNTRVLGGPSDGDAFSAGLGAILRPSTIWNVSVNREGGLDTSFAMSNTTDKQANVTLTLVDGNGTEVSSAMVQLEPRGSMSAFAIAAGGGPAQGDFDGTLQIRSDAALAVLTLTTFQGGFQLNSQPAGSPRIR